MSPVRYRLEWHAGELEQIGDGSDCRSATNVDPVGLYSRILEVVEIGRAVTTNQRTQSLGDDAAPDRAQPVAVVLDIRLAEDVVPKRSSGVETATDNRVLDWLAALAVPWVSTP